MALWFCTSCGTAYAVGLDGCPHCRATGYLADPVGPLAWVCQSPECGAAYAIRLQECPRDGGELRLSELRPHMTVYSGAGGGEAAMEPVAGGPGVEEGGAAARPPSSTSSKAEWVAYQAGRGLEPVEAQAMTKKELVAWEPPAPTLGGEVKITAEAEVARGEP